MTWDYWINFEAWFSPFKMLLVGYTLVAILLIFLYNHLEHMYSSALQSLFHISPYIVHTRRLLHFKLTWAQKWAILIGLCPLSVSLSIGPSTIAYMLTKHKFFSEIIGQNSMKFHRKLPLVIHVLHKNTTRNRDWPLPPPTTTTK